MNINKFTQKSMEAVQNCEKLAYEYGNQQIEQEHLFYSLLTLDDSLILKLLTKMGISKELITNEAQQKQDSAKAKVSSLEQQVREQQNYLASLRSQLASVQAQAAADAQRPLVVDRRMVILVQIVPNTAVSLVRALSVNFSNQPGNALVLGDTDPGFPGAPLIVAGPGNM